MKKIVDLFLESTSRNYWYHGDQHPEPRNSFRDQRMDRDPMYTDNSDELLNGPGIYFTESKAEALTYAEMDGYVYTCIIEGNIITEEHDLTEEMVRKMIEWAPQDKMENLEAEMEEEEEGSFQEYIEENVKRFSNFGRKNFLAPIIGIYDKFYKGEPTGAKEFTDAITYLDIDGIKVKFNDRWHVVVWNPKSIHIQEVESYAEAYDSHYGEDEDDEEIYEATNPVRIYRAQPINTDTIRKDDYITLSVKFAVEHAENNHIYEDEPHVVVTAIVDKNDIRPATNTGEYLSNINVKGDIIYTSKGYEYEGWEEAAKEVRKYLR